MILLTVGTVLPFDRLVAAVDELAGQGRLRDEVFAQVGAGGLRPRHMRSREVVGKPDFDALVAEASCIIGHAGIGTITAAVEAGKPLLVVPRRKEHGELLDDHQVALARHFEAGRHVLVAYDLDQIQAQLTVLPTFVPLPRVTNADRVARRVGAFLSGLR